MSVDTTPDSELDDLLVGWVRDLRGLSDAQDEPSKQEWGLLRKILTALFDMRATWATVRLWLLRFALSSPRRV